MRPGDVVYIKATYKPIHHDGNMLRVITADSGTALWVSPQEVKTVDDIVASADIIRVNSVVNMA